MGTQWKGDGKCDLLKSWIWESPVKSRRYQPKSCRGYNLCRTYFSLLEGKNVLQETVLTKIAKFVHRSPPLRCMDLWLIILFFFFSLFLLYDSARPVVTCVHFVIRILSTYTQRVIIHTAPEDRTVVFSRCSIDFNISFSFIYESIKGQLKGHVIASNESILTQISRRKKVVLGRRP